MTINVCMVGHGMMGTWHSRALMNGESCLHTVVGRESDATARFAAQFGYRRWTTDFNDALADPEVQMVLVAGPSQSHAEMASAALSAGKHVLVEIPLALTLADCEALVAKAETLRLKLGVVHPMRFRTEHIALCKRIAAGEEKLRHVQSRLFLHRLENVGSTGLRRSWTDNLLWHHGAHLVDVCLWLSGGGNPYDAEARIGRKMSILSAPHTKTGIPMEFSGIVELGSEQNVVFSSSYHSRERIFDIFAVTDKDSYRLDILRGTLSTGSGEASILSEEENNAQVSKDFVRCIIEDRQPLVTGASVLPAMRLLSQFENEALLARQHA